MIADFPPISAKQAAERTARLIDEIWSNIPASLPADEALRVAERAIAILATSTDAEFEARLAWPLHLSLALGLAALIAYALIGYTLLAWVSAAAFTGALVIFGCYLLATEPAE